MTKLMFDACFVFKPIMYAEGIVKKQWICVNSGNTNYLHTIARNRVSLPRNLLFINTKEKVPVGFCRRPHHYLQYI